MTEKAELIRSTAHDIINVLEETTTERKEAEEALKKIVHPHPASLLVKEAQVINILIGFTIDMIALEKITTQNTIPEVKTKDKQNQILGFKNFSVEEQSRVDHCESCDGFIDCRTCENRKT